MINKKNLHIAGIHSQVDAVGSSQIFFPTKNLASAYQVDKEPKAVLRYFQYNQCAGPRKLSKLSFSKMLTKNLDQQFKWDGKKKYNVGLENLKFKFMVVVG